MKYNELDIKTLHNKLINNEITSDELVKEAIQNSNNCQKDCNAFDYIYENYLKENIRIW